MRRETPRRRHYPSLAWYLGIGLAVLAIAGCDPPMLDNTPAATGTPVVAAEVVGHWFKLIEQGEPVIEVRPLLIQPVVDALANELLSQIPDLSEETPLYIHVSDALDEGAVADISSGAYVSIEIPEDLQVIPEEQPNGSLLFQGDDFMGFLQEVMNAGQSIPGDLTELPAGLDPSAITITDLTMKLWLYRVSGSDDMYFRLSAEAVGEVPILGRVQLRVTLNGTAWLSEGPDADGLTEGVFEGF